MAGANPPAMKISASWFKERRGLAIGVLIGALTVGSAIPHFIRGVTDLPWRQTLLAASGLATIAALIVWLGVSEGPYRFPPARFDVRMAATVFRERPLRLACFGYFGHMWELYAMWAWLRVVFAENVATALRPRPTVDFALPMVAIGVIPPLADLVGWRWAFAALAAGPFLGVVAMARLRALPDALKLASGRR